MDANEKLAALKKFQSEMAGKNHFELLGVEESADDGAIRKAYFGLLKLYGADYFHHVVDPESRQAVDEVNRQLRVAYDAIGKSAKRQVYIEQLKGGTVEDAGAKFDIASVFEAEQATSQARSLMERGEYRVAIQKLERAHKIDPKSHEIKARLLYAQFMMMDVDDNGKRNSLTVKDTIENLEAACEAMPNADFLRAYLGTIYGLEGDNAKAIEWYKAAQKLNPENLTAKRELKLIEDREKRAKEAENAPKSLMDQVKDLFGKLGNIKFGK